MPILKSFLKDGEAESYQNVQVKFVPGRKAIMTIYESGDDDDEGEEESWVEKEQIVLSDYKTKDEMHALMVEKGFQLKSPEEVEAIQQQYKDEAEAERTKAEERREEMRIRREEMQRQREEKMMEDARAEVEGGGDGSSGGVSMGGLNRDGGVIVDDDDSSDDSSSDDSEDNEAKTDAKEEL
ncbi:hypothetical protein QTG54_016787 [Skeletonema marinoi]|uniref:Selenoprotein F/M domain-containing protein n=1 Tax=Skeletonema marinoi TaxID=267567 RepID=A0AAD8XRJ2_9STRA|nr:hypothetical protein QTG54_016787 [Skeletonema marinoi]|mmetsp:Transcript_29070/g.49536  ORF Transcript_29070/g.49536 Transcript_29070/m.49536 type:complete len:182 (+) Transcript_29070:168-713(+)